MASWDVSVSRIHDFVLQGRITPRDGAMLLELRRVLQDKQLQRRQRRIAVALGWIVLGVVLLLCGWAFL